LEQGADNADDRIEDSSRILQTTLSGKPEPPCRTKRVVYVLSREYLTG